MTPLVLPLPVVDQSEDERRFNVRSFLLWLGVLALVTMAMLAVRAHLDKAHVALGYLLVVLGAGASTGRRIGVTLSVVAFVCFNFFFLPPYHSLLVTRSLDWLVL